MKINKTCGNFFNRPMTGNLSIPIINKDLNENLKMFVNKKYKSHSNDSKNNLQRGNYILYLNNVNKKKKKSYCLKQYLRKNNEDSKDIFSRKLNFIKTRNLITENDIINNQEDEKKENEEKEEKEIESKKQNSENIILNSEKKKDKYIPTNLFKNINSIKNQTKINLIKLKNNKNLKVETIFSSDIFFQKPSNKKKEGTKRNYFREKSQSMTSDIFNRQNPISEYEYQKSSEKSILRNSINPQKFLSNTENNNSYFEEKKQNYPSLITSSNSFFNILVPNKISNCLQKDSIKIYNRTNNISQYNDLMVMNKKYCKQYQKSFKLNERTFYKTNQMCSEYLENYNKGRNLYRTFFRANS